ncbi:Late embryogenesis abundant protein, LEA-14 [Corchorus capsularis]|uniref:Late embryogenesis abundant protein, LEA-14 n=1 Tax=Corchorus capsularis TaxID=210143 RepID=A0A1R3IIZ4_COCAP|nr:Late embryogenesis abundant protein, LEA-14 [Corchorus capsularis]
MAEKQAHLNGAYYGPSVPPTTNYHRPGRGSGCGCGCCLLKCLFQIIATIVVVVGLAVLIFWLIFRPINPIKFHATDVSLTEFNLTNNTLQYNLALNITIRNPNKKIGIYYDRIEARAYYEGERFDSQTLTPFYQGHKTTSHLNPVFQGQHIVLLGNDAISEFNQEKNSGIFSIDVKLYLKIRFRLGKVKVGKFKPKVSCDLKVPLSSVNGSLAGVPETTKCDWDF